MGGQSGTAGHLHLGDFSTIAGKAGVTKSLEGGKTYAGFPAIDHRVWLKQQVKISQLNKR
jgi:UDP-3-O-[3-hydroxymyristoyl] glucosamine N-acyltransferase